MYEGKTHQLFYRYAIPQMIGLLFNSIYLIVDGLFIGNRLGRDAMAAAAVGVPLIEFLIALSMAVTSGAGVLISGQLGHKENTKAVETFNTAILTTGTISLFVAIFGNLFVRPLAKMLGATPQIYDMSIIYLRYIISFSPFLMFSFLLGGLARNDGKPKLAMAALSLGSASNILLDYVFMYPLNMGIGGAALATALGPILSVLILLPHFILKNGSLFFKRLKVRFQNVRRIFSLGFPSFIMEFTIGIITFIYNAAIVCNGYGEIGLAAYLVIGYLILIILTFFLGMAEGLQPIFSYFIGTGELERNQSMRQFATKIFLGVGVVCYLLIVSFSRNFFSLFTPGDIELIDFTQSKSLQYFCGFFLAGFNILMISFWQSTKSTGKALIVSLSRCVLCPPVLIFLLPIFFGRESIWICHSLSEAITACIVIALPLRHLQTAQ